MKKWIGSMVLAFLIAEPAAANCPGEFTNPPYGVTVGSTFGGPAQYNPKRGLEYCPATGDEYELVGSCAAEGSATGVSASWRISNATGCSGCSISPGNSATATLSGLESANIGTIVWVVFRCQSSAGRLDKLHRIIRTEAE